MRIKLFLDLSAAKNASRYFQRAKEVAEEGKKTVRRRAREKEWYEKFRWAFTSSGELLLLGKNASQNLSLIKRYAGPEDFLFHVAEVPGATGLLLGSKDLQEAAQITACFSSAWEARWAVADVFCFKKEQVSLSSKHGTSLPTGSYNIIGKREWFKGMPLRLKAFVDQEGKFRIASVFSEWEGEILLFPGGRPKEKAARKLSEELEVPVEEILTLLPGPCSWTPL